MPYKSSLQNSIDALNRGLKQCNKSLLCSGDGRAHVLGARRISCDERQVDVCLSG